MIFERFILVLVHLKVTMQCEGQELFVPLNTIRMFPSETGKTCPIPSPAGKLEPARVQQETHTKSSHLGLCYGIYVTVYELCIYI